MANFIVIVRLEAETSDLKCVSPIVDKFKSIIEAVDDVGSKIVLKDLSVGATHQESEDS